MTVAALLAAYALVIGWTGGFDLRVAGVRLRSHEWARPLGAACIAFAVATWLDRQRVAAGLGAAWRTILRTPAARVLAIIALGWTIAAAAWFGTFAIGGADSYGYVAQARLIAEGRLTDTVPLSSDFTWPNAEYTLRPLGFTQGRTPGVIAPIYPPGLPLLMAPLTFLGERALYFLVPAFGVLAIWGTYRVGVRLGDPLAGGLAALLLSVSPTFLFQLVQPMSDVPVAACWLMALLLAFRATTASAVGAGAFAAVATLIRPNLAPLATIMVTALVWPRPRPSRRIAAFLLCFVPGLVLLGWIQAVRYGSPLASGYGRLQDGFALANIAPNLARYPAWLTETHTPFVWLWLAAPLWFLRRAEVRAKAAVAFGIIVAVWLAYLPYVYFRPDEWFYTRFLLPALPLMLFFASATAAWGIRRMPVSLRAAALALLTLGLVALMVGSAREHGAFDMRAQEQKYPRAGAFVRDRLPAGAFVLAQQHSGAVRYYAGRPTIRWDLLDPSKLDEVVAILRSKGHEPFVVIDVGEDEPFRRRFESAHQDAIRHLVRLAVLGDARVYGFE